MGRTTETLQEQQGKQEMTITLPPTTPVTPEEMRAELARLHQAAVTNGRATFRGDFLKFVKGKWGAGFGENRKWVPDGSRWVALLNEAGWGWRKFERTLDEDGHEVTKPVYRCGRISENFVLPPREELGDMDRSLWRISMLTKQLEDPWKEVCILPLMSLDGETVVTFITDAPTARDRFWFFIEQASRLGTRHLGEDPVIALKAGGFTSRKTGFWVDVPEFELTGQWTSRRDPALIGHGADKGSGAEQEPPEHELTPLEAYGDDR